MELIHDGYTQRAEVGDTVFLYRPMVYSEAVGVGKIAQSLPREMQKDFIAEVVIAHVVWPCIFEPLKNNLAAIFRLIAGSREQELADEKNLRDGSRLAIRYPHLDQVSCADCKYWWFDIHDGEFCKRGDEYLKRDGAAPCDKGVNCPVGHWKQEKRLNDKNRQAFEHHMTCRATGQFPNDPIVKRNARIINQVIEECQRKSKMSSSK